MPATGVSAPVLSGSALSANGTDDGPAQGRDRGDRDALPARVEGAEGLIFDEFCATVDDGLAA